MDQDRTRTALHVESNLSEEEKNRILKEKYSKGSRGRPMTHRQYIIFYGKTKRLQKKIYARSVEEAVEIFRNKYKSYVPKFARDYWYTEVWTDYSNDKATTEETENS